MTNTALQLFCNRVVDAGQLTQDDLRELATELLPDGLATRDETDLLLALDRAVVSEESFSIFLAAAVVDFVVWGERPTGTIDRDTAAWLAASIGGRSGPTRTGARIAMEVVREAESTDETLIAFALDANGWSRGPAKVRVPVALAA